MDRKAANYMSWKFFNIIKFQLDGTFNKEINMVEMKRM